MDNQPLQGQVQARRLRSAKAFVLGTLLLTCGLLSGCGPDYCKCLEEAKKENPDQATLDKCRESFSKMDLDEVSAAIEKCGK